VKISEVLNKDVMMPVLMPDAKESEKVAQIIV